MKVRNIVAGVLTGAILLTAKGCHINKDYKHYQSDIVNSDHSSRILTDDELVAKELRDDFFCSYDALKNVRDYFDYVNVSDISEAVGDDLIERFDNEQFKKIMNIAIQSNSQFEDHLKNNNPKLKELIPYSKKDGHSYFTFDANYGDDKYFMMISVSDYPKDKKEVSKNNKRDFGDRVALEIHKGNHTLIKDHSVVSSEIKGELVLDVCERQVLHSRFYNQSDKPDSFITLTNDSRFVKNSEGKYVLESQDSKLELSRVGTGKEEKYTIDINDYEKVNYLNEEFVEYLDSEYAVDDFLDNNKALIFRMTDNDNLKKHYDDFKDYYKTGLKK